MVKVLCLYNFQDEFFVPEIEHEQPNLENEYSPEIIEIVQEKRFKCDLCQKSFKSKESRQNHVSFVHLKVKNRVCKFCGKAFASRYHLERHMRNVHQKVLKYKCNHCGKVFGLKTNMRQHIRAVHLGIKPYECDFCFKRFASKKTASDHMNLVHNEKTKRFDCETCDKSFSTKEHCLNSKIAKYFINYLFCFVGSNLHSVYKKLVKYFNIALI